MQDKTMGNLEEKSMYFKVSIKMQMLGFFICKIKKLEYDLMAKFFSVISLCDLFSLRRGSIKNV